MQKEFKAQLLLKTENTEKKILKHKVELNVGKYSTLLICCPYGSVAVQL